MKEQSQKVIAITLTVLFLLLGGFGLWWLHDLMHNQKVTGSSKLGNIGEMQAGVKKDLKEIIDENQKLVVCLDVDQDYGHVLGSGFLYNDQGDIITNAHVVGNATNCQVKMADGTVYRGTVIGRGTDVDIALVRVSELAGKKPMQLAHNHQAEVGDEVLALGSPLGLQNTATTGIISGLNRDLDIENFHYHGLYQISAPISHGSSGGPLLDKNTGEVLGVNTAGAQGEGIGFSIPINQVLSLVEKWSQNPATPASLPATTGHVEDQQSLENMGANLVYYFYDCLNSGNYVDAFALMGSAWQAQQPYENFRKGYLNTLQVEIVDLTTAQRNEDSTQVTVIIRARERSQTGEVTNSYQATYQVGFENDKLKLLSGKAHKI